MISFFSHNIYHFTKFFEKIRECIWNNTLEKLEQHISAQFNSYLKKSAGSVRESQ